LFLGARGRAGQEGLAAGAQGASPIAAQSANQDASLPGESS
jgi:hypothetical protein